MRLCITPLREVVGQIVASAKKDLLLASPYIKRTEAEWVLAMVPPARRSCLRTMVLTDLRSDNVLSGGLDVDALLCLSTGFSQARVVTLPRLHAKVYVADARMALVTSANLTSSGLDTNFEYGVCTDDSQYVCQIREDLEAYARLGSPLDEQTIRQLVGMAANLMHCCRRAQQTVGGEGAHAFDEALSKANHAFLAAQVGRRTAASLFSEAILYVLKRGPLSTRKLHPRIQELLPDLCDDSVDLVINDQLFGKRWKHAVRNAQQGLKRSRKIQSDGVMWSLREPKGST